jgi:hypothetical protein
MPPASSLGFPSIIIYNPILQWVDPTEGKTMRRIRWRERDMTHAGTLGGECNTPFLH